jgi:hypothetical protein
MSKPEDYKLRYLYADDAIHITEFPESYNYSPILININSRLMLKMDSNFIAYDDFYIGNPVEMHSEGYKSIIRLKNINGYKLPKNIKIKKDDEYIIFTFVKHKEFDFYVKLVWVFKMI